MGASPWMYFTKYQPDLERALKQLQDREFEAGRYFPVMEQLPEVIDDTTTQSAPGRRHATLDAAFEEAEEEGTHSILDMSGFSPKPEFGGKIFPVESRNLIEWYGTDKPTQEMIEEDQSFFELIGRLQGCYIIAYKDGHPDEIMFAGCSAD